MKVVIVTGKHAHHKRLCAILAEEFRVVGILHPADRSSSAGSGLRRLRTSVRRQGWGLTLAHIVASAMAKARSRGRESRMACDEASYESIQQSLIYPECDVQGGGAADLLRSLRPDVTVCLGGPIYPQEFIRASPLMLNFHSGVSPIYNGAASIQFAFANGHPHLCGGTLMRMEANVDGGAVLAHYLPELRSGDTPESLFYKTVCGSATLYTRVLKGLESDGMKLQHIAQSSPLFYTRASDFGCHHLALIKKHIRSDLSARYARNATAVEYWREATQNAAQTLYDITINRLLWRTCVSRAVPSEAAQKHECSLHRFKAHSKDGVTAAAH